VTALLPLALLASATPLVSSVRLEVPEGDRARLERYVELRPGEPLSPERIRRAVELLFATGEFADVLVEREDTPAGVALSFRTVPAPLLQAVTVEGDLALEADEVRRAARLRDGEAMWRPRLDRAAAEVHAALRAKGYLGAAVTAEARPRPRGVEAVFTVAAGPRARVRRVLVRGGPAPMVPALEAEARPRPGEFFEKAQADEAAESLRDELRRQGYGRARVEAEATVDGEAVDLVFQVTAGRPTVTRFEGASVSRRARSSVRGLLREGGMESDVADEAADRLEDDLRKRGHRGARVTRAWRTEGSRDVLVFELAAGPRARVADARVEGYPGPPPILATRAGEPLQDALLAEDEKRLAAALDALGYGDAAVEARAPEGGGDVPVVFTVRTGPRTLVREVGVSSPVPVPGTSARELHLQPGRPFRARDLTADREALLAAFRDAGYLGAEVTPEVTLSEDRTEARVLLRVEPGVQVTVERVVIAGLDETREQVVRRELLVSEGKPLGDASVLESQRRLGALGLFSRVSLAQMDPESPARRTVVVTAQEAPVTTVAWGVGYAERDQLRASVEVTRRNLFGLDRSLSAFARASFKGSRFVLIFREPYLFGRRRELFVTAFREEEDRDTFDFVRAGALVQTARLHASGVALILRYSFQLTDTFNVVDPEDVGREFASATFSGPSASVVYDTRDDPFEPRGGRFMSADALFSHEVLGGDGFLKGFFQAAHYQRLRGPLVLALSGRVGLGRTFGRGEGVLLPRPDRFYAGGDYSMRGFAVDAVLPSGGNALVLGGAELRANFGRHLAAALFSDMGNVYPLVGDIDLGDMRYTAGVGLRYRSALGPLRVDWGYKLDRREGEDAYRFHFTLGHAF
jgi:outer membrane protein insertion porin family